MIRKRSDVILNFFEYSRAYVKLYLNFIILLLLRRIVVMTQIGHLQLYFTKLCDNVMKSIAQHRRVDTLVYLKIKLLKKFVFPLNQLFLADSEKNGDFRSKFPEFFVLNNSRCHWIILLPQTQTFLQLEDIHRVVLYFIIIVIGTRHGSYQQIHDQKYHQYMECQKVRVSHPTSTCLCSIMLEIIIIEHIVAWILSRRIDQKA